MAQIVDVPLDGLDVIEGVPDGPSTQPDQTNRRRGEIERSRATRVRQCHVIITPWASGHVTVDLVARDWRGAEHWDRRTGHLDLQLDPGLLSGITARDVLRLLADAAESV